VERQASAGRTAFRSAGNLCDSLDAYELRVQFAASAFPERRSSFENHPIRVGNSLSLGRREESAVSLEEYRGQLKEKLNLGDAFKGSNGEATMRVAELWWTAYKEWEKQDRFLKAFKEGRMTVRQIPVPKEMEAKPIGDIKDYELQYGTYKGKRGDADFAMRRGDVEKQSYPNERYRVGTNALKERMDPANFGMDKSERLKYANGLHDLSASLCVPTLVKLTDQVRWKYQELAVRVTVFMPLALPEDMEIFSQLNAAAKAAKGTFPNGYIRTTEMRRRMTRIKLVSDDDIGAGLRDVSAQNSDKPKIRYGMKEELVGGKLSGVDSTRAENVFKYTKVPKTAPVLVTPKYGSPVLVTKSTNEIVIAYRQHEGVRFPLFTKYDLSKQAFMCHPSEPGSGYIVGGKIPNEWAKTVEV
jgi:hypothetical protein